MKMKLIPRTDMTKHSMPINHWPDWTFSLWALGCADCIACDPSMRDDFPSWKLAIWRVRGPILRAVFARLWWWV